jgi:hypothetical protein
LSSWAVVNLKAQLFEKAQSPGEKCGWHRGFRESAEISDKARKAQSFCKSARSAGILKKNARSLRISSTKHGRPEDFGQCPKSAVFLHNTKYFWQSVVFYIL